VCHAKRWNMDHTVFLTCKLHNACLSFVSIHQMASVTPNWGSRHPIATYYSFIDPKGMKGWVGLVGWPIADGLPRLSARRGRSPAKNRRSTTVPRSQFWPLTRNISHQSHEVGLNLQTEADTLLLELDQRSRVRIGSEVIGSTILDGLSHGSVCHTRSLTQFWD